MYDYDLFDPFYEKPRGSWVIDVVFWLIGVVVLYTFVWFVFGIRSTTACTDIQKVVEVQASGHRQTTDYYVRGDEGGVIQGDTITQVGEEYCFNSETDTYYKARNYFKPWENNQ